MIRSSYYLVLLMGVLVGTIADAREPKNAAYPVTERAGLWPNQTVPVLFDPQWTQAERRVILAAFHSWTTHTIYPVSLARQCDGVPCLRIVKSASRICVSNHGARADSTMQLSTACLHPRVLRHEFGHVLGLMHPIQAPDWCKRGYTFRNLDAYHAGFLSQQEIRTLSASAIPGTRSVMGYAPTTGTRGGRIAHDGGTSTTVRPDDLAAVRALQSQGVESDPSPLPVSVEFAQDTWIIAVDDSAPSVSRLRPGRVECGDAYDYRPVETLENWYPGHDGLWRLHVPADAIDDLTTEHAGVLLHIAGQHGGYIGSVYARSSDQVRAMRVVE